MQLAAFSSPALLDDVSVWVTYYYYLAALFYFDLIIQVARSFMGGERERERERKFHLRTFQTSAPVSSSHPAAAAF